jgi:hypothetical protein
MKIKATVFFGRERKKTVRTFRTQEELHAYMRGVDDSNGWMEYSISEGTKGQLGDVASELWECYDVLSESGKELG